MQHYIYADPGQPTSRAKQRRKPYTGPGSMVWDDRRDPHRFPIIKWLNEVTQ